MLADLVEVAKGRIGDTDNSRSQAKRTSFKLRGSLFVSRIFSTVMHIGSWVYDMCRLCLTTVPKQRGIECRKTRTSPRLEEEGGGLGSQRTPSTRESSGGFDKQATLRIRFISVVALIMARMRLTYLG